MQVPPLDPDIADAAPIVLALAVYDELAVKDIRLAGVVIPKVGCRETLFLEEQAVPLS